MTGKLLYPGEILSLSAQTADRLIRSGSGDAALLYLFLLRRGGTLEEHAAIRALRWDGERLQAAFAALVSAGLADAKAVAEPPAAPPEPEPPEYTAADIAQELGDPSSFFPGLVGEVQRRLGKILSTADLKMLYHLYDYLALPAEVIMLLVNYCIEETERRFGPGRMPRLSQIQKEAFVWRRLGIDTAEAAERHLQKLSALRDRTRAILPLLGIRDREPVAQERSYIAKWFEMGFDDGAIRLAYERTVLKKQSMSWTYMNSILRSWHTKGLHTVDEVRSGDSEPARTSAAAEARRTEDDLAQMRAYLQQEKGVHQ